MVQLLSSLVLATVATFISCTSAVDAGIGSSFSSQDGSINFAINVPEGNDNKDLYFSMQAPSVSTWIAIGMGSNRMKDSLIFMAYSDSTGKNITLSPRLAHGHVEPSYTKNVSLTILPGSGIKDGNFTVNAKCSNCRKWKGGSIVPTDTAAKFIYATGPGGNLKSNSLSADVKRHDLYGAFTMDLTKAVGVGGVPVVNFADSLGTVQTQDKSDRDYAGPARAILMVGTFLGLMPVAVVLLRVFNSPKLHGMAQVVSVTIALMGVGVGIYAGTQYNRTKNFNSAHQIFGLIIIIAMIGQFVLGVLHHRIYKKTQSPTKLAPIHIWLGRVVIPAGIINGFLGFPLALNPRYDWALLICFLFVLIVAGPFAFWRFRRNNKQKKGPINEDTGYQAQPWARSQANSDVNLGQWNHSLQQPGYEPQYPMPTQGRQFA